MQHADGIYFFKASFMTSFNRKLDCMPLAVCRLHAATICMIVRSSLSDSFKKIKILISNNVRYQSSSHGYRDCMNVAKC